MNTPLGHIEDAVVGAFATYGCLVNDWARRKQWWDAEDGSPNKSLTECIMLVVTELSEAVESARHDDPPSEHIPAFSGVEEELADAVIRIMDLSTQFGYRVGEAIIEKMKFNEGRPIKHGKLF